MRRTAHTLALALAAALMVAFHVNAAENPCRDFETPPDSARPWVYWFWQDGNITREGITADLEAMKRTGIGGVLILEVAHGAPPGPVRFLSREWRGMVTFALSEARRLGIAVNMNNDGGWSGSGGPWITPDMAMKKLTISETQVGGGRKFSGALPMPETIKKAAYRGFYRDIAVLAFPTPAADLVEMAGFSPKGAASVGGGGVNPQNLCDPDLRKTLVLPRPDPGSPQWAQISFDRPFTTRTIKITLVGPPKFMMDGHVEASDDGAAFRKICDFNCSPPDVVINIPETTARSFRVVFTRSRHPRIEKVTIAAMSLAPSFRLENLSAKAAFISAQFTVDRNVIMRPDWPVLPPSLVIPRDSIIDISSKMDPTGRLVWDAPGGGEWTVLRIGYTLTGRENHPAPKEATGLESDKLSKEATRLAFDGLVAKVLADNPGIAGQDKTLQSIHVDSWEAQSQNWTQNMPAEFKRLRGYDMMPFLPVITGRVVGSVEVSERFLWDLRETISELLRENYAAELRRLANEKGLRLSIEAYYGPPADEIAYGGEADEPHAEFWRPKGAHYSPLSMSSSAHIYGRKIVAAEAFTAGDKERWLDHPGTMKDEADWAFCQGVNRFVFHRYAMQPWPDRKPGMPMGHWGVHYERTQTWWEQSTAWHRYLARCQYVLQQGLFVADVCVVQPEGTSRFEPPAYLWPAPAGKPLPAKAAPGADRPGCNFDGCPASAVLTRMSVKNGRLVLPDGMSYGALLLPDTEFMTPQLLRKVKEFADAGATIIGRTRPVKSPSLAGYPQCDAEVRRLAAGLWDAGKVISDKIPSEVFAAKGVPPDFTARNQSGANNLRFIHKTVGGDDFYFVSNKTSETEDTVCEFRMQGRRPELWRPEGGQRERVAAYEESGGCVRMPLRLGPNESVFVVFARGADVEPQRIVSASHNGKTLFEIGDAAAPAPAPGPGAFTMSAWVKPAIEIELPGETNKGYTRARQNYAIYAAPGHEVFGARTETGAGISAGTNGIVVMEHGAGLLTPVLVHAAPAPLTGWTHIAVVYRDGVPSLFVNGQLARQGVRSQRTPHGSVDARHGRKVEPFSGECAGAQQFDGALDASALAALAQGARPQPGAAAIPAAPLEFSLTRNARGALELSANQGGVYMLRDASGKTTRITIGPIAPPQPIGGPWSAAFEPKWGGPEKPVVFATLSDWAGHADARVRGYSGTAVYRTTFTVPALAPGAAFAQPRAILDLGRVAVVAEVILNGKNLGILWRSPWRVDATPALKTGENQLEVRVTNLWINRMIADEGLPEDSERKPTGELATWPQWLLDGKPSPAGRHTFTAWRLWKKDEACVESGLLGPVTLQFIEGGRQP